VTTILNSEKDSIFKENMIEEITNIEDIKKIANGFNYFISLLKYDSESKNTEI